VNVALTAGSVRVSMGLDDLLVLVFVVMTVAAVAVLIIRK
jgi:hypothetical protein